MEEDSKVLPFRVEYAKSGRAGCKGCKDTIAKDSLRMAIMVQSPFFDGMQPNWFHYSCFWKRSRIAQTDDIHGFNSLRWEDQQKIETQIENGTAVPVTTGKAKKGKKAEVPAGDPATREFRIDYAKSGGSKCRSCEEKIKKGTVRLGKMDYESEQSKMYGPQCHWHHKDCFLNNRITVGFTADLSVATIPGFSDLEKDDQKLLETLLGKGDPRPKSVTNAESSDKAKKGSKKRKVAEENEENSTGSSVKKVKEEPGSDLKSKLREQSQAIWKVRDELEQSGLTSRDMKDLLEMNNQHVPVAGKLVERIADCLLFGAPASCPQCKNGQLVYSDTGNGYRCLGQITEWAKCEFITKEPKMKPFHIPDDEHFMSVPVLAKYDFKKSRKRIYPQDRKLPEPIIKSEPGSSLHVTDQNKPLQMLKFVVAGRFSTPINQIRTALNDLGATIAAEVDGTVIALVASDSEIKKGKKSKYIQAAETANVDVVDEKFVSELVAASKDGILVVCPADEPLDSKKSDGSVILHELVSLHNSFSQQWGGNAHKRIKLSLAKSLGLVSKSVSKSLKSEAYKSGVDTKRYKVKGRSAVDPDSGLEDKAHVLDEGNCIWNSVLNLVSVTAGTNSYYRLQLLEHDKKPKWWIFRAWGRIGTTIGGEKLEEFRSKDDAKSVFENLFFDKTGNEWNKGKFSRQKHPGKHYPVDVDFGPDPIEESKALSLAGAGAGSKLPPSVKDLIRLIFDVKMMKQIMAELEIDLKKLPLGRLSKTQIKSAYSVLSELQNIIESKPAASSNYLYVDASNRFYSLIPHDFGINAPPMIDTLDAIKEKTTMLDELMQIELAYKMLSGGADSTEDPLDVHYKQLNTNIVPVEKDSDEFKLLEKYVKNTHAPTHQQYKLIIQDVFRIEREGELDRFKPFQQTPNHKLLWHGSRLTNYVGILSQGLRIAPPEAPSTGYMFGKGVYFADMVSKSANYCYTSAANNTGLVLLSDVALGIEHDVLHAQGFSKAPSGFHSVKGVGMTHPDPSGEIKIPVADANYELSIPCGKPVKSNVKGSSLLYNEFIVYDVSQVRLRYLLRMEFKYNM